MRDGHNRIIDKAPNFKYNEFTRSYTAIRKNINNIPSGKNANKIWGNIEYLATNILQPVRNEFGPIRILSGYRSFRLNLAIRGSLTSHHLTGCAADIEPVDNSVKLIDILSYIHNELKYTELIAEYFPKGWVHVAIDCSKGYSNQIKLKDDNHNYTKVDLDYIIQKYK